jgi:hypothetical protein
MKPFFSNALLAALLAVGTANAATTTPVGYETVNVSSGFNYLGLRLQRSTVLAGTVTAVTGSSITDSSASFGTTLTAGTTYILEVANTNGVTQEFLGSAASGDTLNIPGLSSAVSVGDKYKIRTAATLSSLFGAENSAGLDTGFFGPGGDVVYIPNASGGFDQYYYDSGYSSWANSNGEAVDGSAIAINYADSIIISATGAGASTLVVSGEVKTAKTGYALSASSFNYLGSVYPAGATLSSSFDAAVPTMDTGFFGPGGDIVYVPNGAGGFNQYYYDSGYSSWADSDGNAIDATAISLQSGVIIYNDGAAASLVNSAPTSYSSL